MSPYSTDDVYVSDALPKSTTRSPKERSEEMELSVVAEVENEDESMEVSLAKETSEEAIAE